MSFNNRIRAVMFAVVLAAMPFGAAIVTLQPISAAAQAPAADAPKADAPKAAAPVVAKETVENPYGLKHTIEHGDLVSKTVLALLLIMSMGSWYILIVKLVEQRRLLAEAKAASETFWQAGTVKQGIDTLKEESAFRYIAERGVAATQHHEGMMGEVPLSDWITMGVQRASDEVSSRLSDGLAFLATVGSTSPFVGLFGTVWGILNALTAIGVAGQASIDKVAGPVGEALIMTAIGLAVAVPAVLSYNWLVRRNKQCVEKLRAFSADLHSVLLSTAAKKK